MQASAETTPQMASPSRGPLRTPVLFGLAAVTGIVDAVCYLAFGHVGFVMNVLAGAAVGAVLLRYSAALPLGIAGAASTVCAVAAYLDMQPPSRIAEGTRP